MSTHDDVLARLDALRADLVELDALRVEVADLRVEVAALRGELARVRRSWMLAEKRAGRPYPAALRTAAVVGR